MTAVKRTISIPSDLDEELRAYELPISAICQKALRGAVEELEDNRRRIVVTTTRGREGFLGRWIIRPDDDAALTELTKWRGQGKAIWDAGHHYAVAITEQGRLVVYVPETHTLTFCRTLPGTNMYLPEDVRERVKVMVDQTTEEPIIWHEDW